MAGVCFLHHLDELVAGGCQSPVCPHEHSDGLFLAPFCHGPVGVCVGITDEVEGLPCDAVLQLRCWRCHAEITQVAIVAPVTDFHSCAHEQACDVLYNAGQLTVSCRQCQVTQFKVPVAPYVPA